MIIKINNFKESIACQKYLFKKGYSWGNSGKELKYYNIDYIHTDSNLKKFTYIPIRAKEYYTQNVVDFNIMMREYKLKRILDDI